MHALGDGVTTPERGSHGDLYPAITKLHGNVLAVKIVTASGGYNCFSDLQANKHFENASLVQLTFLGPRDGIQMAAKAARWTQAFGSLSNRAGGNIIVESPTASHVQLMQWHNHAQLNSVITEPVRLRTTQCCIASPAYQSHSRPDRPPRPHWQQQSCKLFPPPGVRAACMHHRQETPPKAGGPWPSSLPPCAVVVGEERGSGASDDDGGRRVGRQCGGEGERMGAHGKLRARELKGVGLDWPMPFVICDFLRDGGRTAVNQLQPGLGYSRCNCTLYSAL